MTRKWLGLAVVALVVGLVGCGGGGQSGSEPNGSATLGSDGGRLAAESVEVVVPPGAMSSSTTIRVAADSTGAPLLPRWAKGAGAVLQLTPYGTTFAEPVTVRLAAPDVTLAANERLMIAKAQPGGTWEVLGDTQLVDGQLEVKVTSFSYFTPVVVSYVPTTTVSFVPFGMSPLALRCDDGPCPSQLLLSSTVLTASSSGNGGALPANCVDPKIELRHGADTLVSVAATPTVVLNHRVAWNTIARRYVDGTHSLSAQLVCRDPATNATSALALTSAQFGLDSFASFAAAPTVRQFPTALTLTPGDAPTLAAVLMRGASYRQSLTFFVGPTASDAALVYLERLAPGDSAWRIAQTKSQFNANPSPTGAVAWAYWGLDFTLGAVIAADNGTRYRVRACYQAPSATTTSCNTGPVATITVVQQTIAPNFTQQPASVLVQPGQTASFAARAGGTPTPTLQWETRAAGETAWGAVSSGSGATGTDFTTAPVTLADNGRQYRVVATNAGGKTISEAVTLSVTATAVAPTIGSQPMPLTVVAGSEALFAVSAQGTAALSYQWLRNGVAITGANSAQLRLPAVTGGDAATYSVRVSNTAGSVTSNGAALTVSPVPGTAPVAPVIVTQPAAVAVNEGNVATFAVGVTGSGPITFQWRRNGVAIPGATAAALTIPAVSSANAGTYSVVVVNSAGSVTSQSATLAVVPSTGALVAPTISTHPVSVVTVPRATATLAVAASGSGPLSYQWYQDGSPVTPGNGPTLTFDSIDGISNGSYTVTVSNAAGSVTSAPAQLLVVGAPQITAQPQAISVTDGATATFSVQASGELLRYQWSRNGVAIDGAVEASFTTDPLAPADSGAVYTVIVYNGAGLVTSSGAVLTVTTAGPPPGMVLFAGDFSSAGTAIGTGTAARFDSPQGLTADASGNLYVASSNGKFVSKIDPGAAVTHLFFAPITATSFFANPALAPDGSLFVGSSSWCGLWRAAPPLTAPAPVTEITLANCPVFGSNGLSVDPQGRVAIADTSRHAIILATQQPGGAWTQSYFAGGTNYFDGDANRGSTDATGTAARFSGPTGLAYAANGDLFVADHDNGTIRRITPAGEVSTFAGAAGQQSTLDGTSTSARFDRPYGLAFDPDGNLIVLQLGASTAAPAWVRRVTMGGVVTTLFDARAEAAALASDGNAVANARSVKGIAAPGSKRIAISAGNAVLVRTLP